MDSFSRINWLRSALFYFFIAATLGLILRFSFIIKLPDWFEFKNFQHAHSHVAMMGWLSAAFYALICHFYQLSRKLYTYIFWAIQIAVLGMLLSFPIQGYAFFSILFSSIHMILFYFFLVISWKDIHKKTHFKQLVSFKFLKAAFFFNIFSTLGVWALAPIMASGLKGSPIYQAAVQFFLHFQFNGWFVFGLFAFLFRIFEVQKIKFDLKNSQLLYWTLLLSSLLTLALPFIWFMPQSSLYWINGLGIFIQLISIFFLIKILRTAHLQAKNIIEPKHLFLWMIAFSCFFLKILFQSFSVFPFWASASYNIRHFIIGFIHLLMLGSLSTFIFGLGVYFKLKLSEIGIKIFLAGLLFSEVLLFGQGMFVVLDFNPIAYFYFLLFGASLLLVIGIFLVLMQSSK